MTGTALRAPAPLPGHDDRQRRRHALEGDRELAEQLAVCLDPHGPGCGHGGAARVQIGNPGQAEVRAAPSYATQMNGLADEQDLRLRFDVLTKTKQPELCRYWTTRDRAANVRLFRLAAEVLQAIESGVFHPNPGWQCKDCQFRSQCWAWRQARVAGGRRCTRRCPWSRDREAGR